MSENIANYTCTDCHMGIMHAKRVTYLTQLDNELITVPNFLAWICDVCGKREYDESSIQWLNIMLDPNAGKPTQTHRRKPPLPRPHNGFIRPILDS
jgi:YgiT-type zinc finger domain-containing protein